MHLAESSSTLSCLWTGLSLPVALHPASRRRSYLPLRTAQCSRPIGTFTLLLVRTLRRTSLGPSGHMTGSLNSYHLKKTNCRMRNFATTLSPDPPGLARSLGFGAAGKKIERSILVIDSLHDQSWRFILPRWILEKDLRLCIGQQDVASPRRQVCQTMEILHIRLQIVPKRPITIFQYPNLGPHRQCGADRFSHFAWSMFVCGVSARHHKRRKYHHRNGCDGSTDHGLGGQA